MPRLRAVGPPVSHADVLIRRLSHFAHLTAEEIMLLRSVAASPQQIPVGTEIIHEGQVLDKPSALMAGWACRYRALPDGRRQIFDFTLPGELYGMCHRPQAVALTTAVTLTPAVIADARMITEAVKSKPAHYANLEAALFSTASLDEAYLLNQLVRIGRQTAYERVAHLILELHQRLQSVGLAEDWTYALPLTQEILADALGLSVVHLNRTLQQLRRENLIEFKSGKMTILQPGALEAAANFHPPKITFAMRAIA
jgi:CRP-like cAMP-binding protein